MVRNVTGQELVFPKTLLGDCGECASGVHAFEFLKWARPQLLQAKGRGRRRMHTASRINHLYTTRFDHRHEA
jgi:hypothetical protein